MKNLFLLFIVLLTMQSNSLAQLSEFKLLPSDGTPEALFGFPCQISGDYAIVAAQYDNNGSAYIFKRNGLSWIEEQKLLPSDGNPGPKYSVSISGDYAIVGYGSFGGAAYIFKRDGSSWTEEQKLVVNVSPSNFFGISVSISGDYAIVGADGDRDNGFAAGAAYIFKRDGSNWIEEQKLLPSDGGPEDYFGTNVSISGDYALVGADFNDVLGYEDAGAAYIFKRDGSNWTEEERLIPANINQYRYFGLSVSIYGNEAIVGTNGGYAYIFKKVGSNWIEEQQINGSSPDRFGRFVSISGDYAIVSAFDDDENGDNSGSAYLYELNGSSWTEVKKILASDGEPGDRFGISVSIDGDNFIIGAFEDDDNGNNSGSAYAYNTLIETQDFLQIASPGEGDILAIGDQIEIYWIQNGDYNSFSLDLSTDGGVNWSNIVNNINGSQSSYQWNVSSGVISSECKIRITGNLVSGGIMQDESDGLFTIVFSNIIFDDFTYSSNSDPELLDKWFITNEDSDPPNCNNTTPYRKEMIHFEDDPNLQGNKFMVCSTYVVGNGNDITEMKCSRIQTVDKLVKEGTIGARVLFDNSALQNQNGNVESFYTLNYVEDRGPEWAECDFQYLPYDVWDISSNYTESLYLSAWHSGDPVTGMVSSDIEGRIEDWNILWFEALNGTKLFYYMNNYLLDSLDYTLGGDPVYPDNYMNISFANWFAGYYDSGNCVYYLGDNTQGTSSEFKIDWVIFQKKWGTAYNNPAYFADTELEIMVEQLRNAGISSVNTLNGSTVTAVEEEEVKEPSSVTTNYILEQNYPNPFNPSTKIRFSIPEFSNVTIQVYDILGREVTTLLNEERSTGIYEIEFDGSELPSGIYFYQLQAGDYVETKKMLLIK